MLRFIHAKNDQHSLTNFNISVNVTDQFLKAVDNNEWFQLEFNGESWTESIFDPVRDGDYVVYRRPDGSTVTFCDQPGFRNCRSFELHDRRAADAGNGLRSRHLESHRRQCAQVCRAGHRFHRRSESSQSHDDVDGTDLLVQPCGEQFLHFSNSCNLGSIDVAKFYDPENRVDWDRLREVTHLCTRFLDNVIDTCAWPLPEINDVVKRTRPVGLGIMGFADLCLNLKITYGSAASIDLMEEVMGFIRREAWMKASIRS